MTLEQETVDEIIKAIKNGQGKYSPMRGLDFVLDYDNEPETQGFEYDYDRPPEGRIKDNYTVKSIELWKCNGTDTLLASCELYELERIQTELNSEGWIDA